MKIKIFIKGIRRHIAKDICCVWFVIIWLNEFVGKNPPVDTNVILKLSALNNLTPERLRIKKIVIDVIKYNKNIFNIKVFVWISVFIPPSSLKVKLFNLNWNSCFEKIITKNNKK